MATGQGMLNAPPPSPATDPTAAQESNPMSKLAGGPPGGGAPQGPDFSGVLQLGQKLVEGMLALASALPSAAGDIGKAAEMLKNALAGALETAGGTGSSSTLPLTAGQGMAVTPTGTQYPGGGFNGGRPNQ